MKATVADEVVAKAQGGDEAAFRAIVESCSRDVFRLAFRITGNEEDAEDAVQETFIRAYQRIDAFEARAGFRTWLYRVTANASIDVLRRRRRVEQRSAPLEPENAGEEPRQDRIVFGRQVREHLDGALSELSELERAAFALRHFEERSLAEISETLDITVSATKQAVFRAVRKVRKALAPVMRNAL